MMLDPELEEVARRAQQLYDDKLKADLEKNHWGEFVTIDPTSGDYYLRRKLNESLLSIYEAHPGRLYYTLRVGHDVAVEIGGGGTL